MRRRNPLKSSAPHVSHPIPPDLDDVFKQFLGRSAGPADQEGIHTSVDARVALSYTNDTARGIVFSIDVRGLKPELEFEQIALKAMFQSELKMMRQLAKDIAQLQFSKGLMEEMFDTYESVGGSFNPIGPFLQNNQEALLKKMLKSGVTDDILFEITTCQRYLADLDMDRIVQIELINDAKNLVDPEQIVSIYLNKDLEKSAKIEYHGTSLEYALEAFPEIKEMLP